MKHIKLYEQFINEKKDELFTAYIEDKRNPGGSDKDIMDDYGLQVKNRDRNGFDIVGYKADIEAFINDYSIVLDDEIQVYEAKYKGPWVFYVADDSVLKSPQFKNNSGYVKDMGKDLGVDTKSIEQEDNAINKIIKGLGTTVDKAVYITADNYDELMSHAKVAMARNIKFAKQGDFILDPKETI